MSLRLSLFSKELLLVALADAIAVLATRWILSINEAPAPVTSISLSLPVLAGILMGLTVLFVVFYFRRIRSLALRFFLALAVIIGTSTIVGLVGGLLVLFLFLKIKRVWAHDLALMLTMAGIGVAIGLQFSPLIIVGALVVMSLYDIYAVYRSGHMIKLAKQMIESGAIPGYILPQSWKNFGTRVAEAKLQFGAEYMLLGSGDVVFPILLISSVARQSMTQGIIVAIFSLFGLFLTHVLFINQASRRPMAALPPIATLSIIGYLFTNLL